MKRFHYIAVAALTLLFTMPELEAQNNNTTVQQQKTTRRTPQASKGSRTKENNAPNTNASGLTLRAEDMNERMTQEIGNARWIRIIYRKLDLMQEQNAPLYYPTQPLNGQKNLFTTIFQLVCEGKLAAYEYLDGYEDFSDSRKLDLKVMLDRFYILYETTPAKGGQPASYTVNESDVPSADVKSFYVKEAWYFDQNNSVFDVKTLAVCPILTNVGDIGETTMPMFWIPYENLRPYINHTLIMTSNTNNAMTFTIDDYFRRRMFKGEIIKAQNLMNQPLQAYCPTPDSLKKEQEKIEGQLEGFEKALYPKPDSTQLAADNSKASKTKGRATKTTTKKTASVKQEKTAKAPAVKAEKSSPVRSVRRRR